MATVHAVIEAISTDIERMRDELLSRLGNDAIDMIKERTSRHVSADGVGFPELSRKYSAFKGREGKPQVRDLTLTGDMFNGIVMRKDGDATVVLTFTNNAGGSRISPKAKATMHNFADSFPILNLPEARFWEFSDDDVNTLQQLANRYTSL